MPVGSKEQVPRPLHARRALKKHASNPISTQDHEIHEPSGDVVSASGELTVNVSEGSFNRPSTAGSKYAYTTATRAGKSGVAMMPRQFSGSNSPVFSSSPNDSPSYCRKPGVSDLYPPDDWSGPPSDRIMTKSVSEEKRALDRAADEGSPTEDRVSGSGQAASDMQVAGVVWKGKYYQNGQSGNDGMVLQGRPATSAGLVRRASPDAPTTSQYSSNLPPVHGWDGRGEERPGSGGRRGRYQGKGGGGYGMARHTGLPPEHSMQHVPTDTGSPPSDIYSSPWVSPWVWV